MTLTQKPPTGLQKNTKTSWLFSNNDSGFIQVEYKIQTDDTSSQFYKFIIIDNFRTSLKLKVVGNFRVKSFIDFVIIHINSDFVFLSSITLESLN